MVVDCMPKFDPQKWIARIAKTPVKQIPEGKISLGKKFVLSRIGGDNVLVARDHKDNIEKAVIEWSRRPNFGKNELLVDIQGLPTQQQYNVARVIIKNARRDARKKMTVYDGPYERNASKIEGIIKGD